MSRSTVSLSLLILALANQTVIASYPMPDHEYGREMIQCLQFAEISAEAKARATERLTKALTTNRIGTDVWPIFLCAEVDEANDTIVVLWADPNGAGDAIQVLTNDGQSKSFEIDEETEDVNRLFAMGHVQIKPCLARLNLKGESESIRKAILREDLRIILQADHPFKQPEDRIEREIQRYQDRIRWRNDYVKDTAQESSYRIDTEAFSVNLDLLRQAGFDSLQLLGCKRAPGSFPFSQIQAVWFAKEEPVTQIKIQTERGESRTFHTPPFVMNEHKAAMAAGFGLFSLKVRHDFDLNRLKIAEAELVTKPHSQHVPPIDAEFSASVARELGQLLFFNPSVDFLKHRWLDAALLAKMKPQLEASLLHLTEDRPSSFPMPLGHYADYSETTKQLSIGLYWCTPDANLNKVVVRTSKGGTKGVRIDPSKEPHRTYLEIAWQLRDLNQRVLFCRLELPFEKDPGEVLAVRLE